MIYVWAESRDSVSSYIDTISLSSIFVILDIPQVNRHWAFSEWWKIDHFWSFLFSIVSISHYLWFSLFVARSIHSVISRLMLFVSITAFNVDDVFVLIMKSIELLLSWIHLISIISRLSYDWRRLWHQSSDVFLELFSVWLNNRIETLNRCKELEECWFRIFFSTFSWSRSQCRNYESFHTTRRSARFESLVCIWWMINVWY
jgi:hypothetical protein